MRKSPIVFIPRPRSISVRLVPIALMVWLATALTSSVPAANPIPGTADFIRRHCADCHDSSTKEAGLDLTTLPSILRIRQISPAGCECMIVSRLAKCRQRPSHVRMLADVESFVKSLRFDSDQFRATDLGT